MLRLFIYLNNVCKILMVSLKNKVYNTRLTINKHVRDVAGYTYMCFDEF